MANKKSPKNLHKNSTKNKHHNNNNNLINNKIFLDDVSKRLTQTNIETNKKSPKKSLFFSCIFCDYYTSNSKDYKKHIETEKHLMLTVANIFSNKNPQNQKIYECLCGNNYKHRSSLSKHKKKCKYVNNNTIIKNINDTDLDNNSISTNNEFNNINKYNNYTENKNSINPNEYNNINEYNNVNKNNNIKNLNNKANSSQQINYSNYDNNTINQLVNYLMKENTELKQEMRTIIQEQNNYMLEVIKSGSLQINNINTTNNNSNNNTFNLQFFLNETCKDAMNITDFIDSIKLQLNDFVNIGELGYIEGISQIITTNLKALDVHQRPIHCTDNKRDILYIKDKNKWEKEDENKNKIRSLIKTITNKNIKLIPQFREKYPAYSNPDSKLSEQYNKLIKEAMGGNGDNNEIKENKIIKNISKVTTIDKLGN